MYPNGDERKGLMPKQTVSGRNIHTVVGRPLSDKMWQMQHIFGGLIKELV